jgi:hypothetical protein
MLAAPEIPSLGPLSSFGRSAVFVDTSSKAVQVAITEDCK